MSLPSFPEKPSLESRVPKALELGKRVRQVVELEELDRSSCVGPWLTGGTTYLVRSCVTYELRALVQGPGIGRPCSMPITQAVKFRAKGVPWNDVCECVIPGYRELAAKEQRSKAGALSAAVRMRRFRHRKRKTRVGF